MGNYYFKVTKPIQVTEEIKARFWRHVDVGDNSVCWEWTGGLDSKGYGTIRHGGADRRRMLAHRLSFAINKGELVAGLVVCHACDNPKCVNPAHLFQATQRQNTVDAVIRGRLKPPQRKAGTLNINNNIDEIVAALHCGETQKEIAIRFGTSQTTVSHIKTAHFGLVRKLSDEQVLAVYAAYKNGEKPSKIARRTGLNYNTVKGICAKRNYACLAKERLRG